MEELRPLIEISIPIPPFSERRILPKHNNNTTISFLLHRYSPIGLGRPTKVDDGVPAPIKHDPITVPESYPGISLVPDLDVLVRPPLGRRREVVVGLDRFRRGHALTAIRGGEGRATVTVGDREQRGEGGKDGSGED